MIDFKEVPDYEKFEDLCDILLKKEGLATRRLGRGPGQLGKDIIANEKIIGQLSNTENRTWLVECKFTDSGGSISENEVQNIRDRVEAQRAFGYMLFTNCRLRVNLERTLNGLKKSEKIGINIWTADRIAGKVILYSDIFRAFFPISFTKWIKENRIIYVNQTRKIKSPLVHVQNCLRLIKDAPDNLLDVDSIKKILNEPISIIYDIVDDLDKNLQILEGNTFCQSPSILHKEDKAFQGHEKVIPEK